MIKIEMKGIENLQKKLNKLQDDAIGLNGQSFSLSELLSDDFLRKFTKFESFKKLQNGTRLKLTKLKTFSNDQKKELDKYVQDNSNFKSWHRMIVAAGAEKIREKLSK